MQAPNRRLALITGANKGIGFEICRQLARKGLRVLLTSRDPRKGVKAQKILLQENLDVLFHELDVTVLSSVQALVKYVEREHGGVDALVNNAGIMIDSSATSILREREDVFHATLETNFFGALRMCQGLVPLMRKRGYGRVVNLSSGLGQLTDMGDGNAAYRMSKTALNTLTRMVASAMEQQDILVNSMCPGWVRTDMGGPNASRSVEKGAETAVWLATLPGGGPTGGLFRDKKPIPW
ncbi:MAG TPA: SDR family oxidoreductase [Burkholderiales bacterium]|nr:SDR family oxidoreductase [Burkholderiales bacterium]